MLLVADLMFQVVTGRSGSDIHQLCCPDGEALAQAPLMETVKEEAGAVAGRCLVLGNEGQGISPNRLEICQPITVPMKSGKETLNVVVAGLTLEFLLIQCWVSMTKSLFVHHWRHLWSRDCLHGYICC